VCGEEKYGNKIRERKKERKNARLSSSRTVDSQMEKVLP